MEPGKKKIAAIILHLLLFLFGAWGILSAVFNILNCDADHWNWGWKVFKFYTNDSNIIAGCSGLAIALFHIIHYKKKAPIPTFLLLWQLVGTSMLLLTFLTVVGTLGQSYTLWALFGFPSTLFLHTLSPLLSTFLFLFFHRVEIKRKWGFLCLIPVVTYILVWLFALLALNLPKEMELDPSIVPYFFMAIHAQPWYMTLLWSLGISFGQLALGFGILLAKNAIAKKKPD